MTMDHQETSTAFNLVQNATSNACTHLEINLKKMGDLTLEPVVRIPFGALYATLFVVGLAGNGGVLLTVGRTRHLQTARNVLLINLMLADVLLCITSVPITPHYLMTKQWVMGRLLCRVLPMAQSITVFVTSLSLTAIAVDKFVHITQLMREPIRLRTAGLITVAIWALSVLTNVPYLLSYDQVDGTYYKRSATVYCGLFCDEVNWPSKTHRSIYGTLVTVIQFLLPFVVILVCYAAILLKVSRDMICDNRQFSGSLTSRQRSAAVNRRKWVTLILIMMVLAFFAAWFPLTLVNLLRDYDMLPKFMDRQPYFYPLLAHFVAMTTVFWNPLLFFWLTRGRQRHVAKLMVVNTTTMFNSFVGRLQQTTTPSDARPTDDSTWVGRSKTAETVLTRTRNSLLASQANRRCKSTALNPIGCFVTTPLVRPPTSAAAPPPPPSNLNTTSLHERVRLLARSERNLTAVTVNAGGVGASGHRAVTTSLSNGTLLNSSTPAMDTCPRYASPRLTQLSSVPYSGAGRKNRSCSPMSDCSSPLIVVKKLNREATRQDSGAKSRTHHQSSGRSFEAVTDAISSNSYVTARDDTSEKMYDTISSVNV